MNRWKKTLIITASVLLFLVILNFALEPVALHYANKALSELKEYKGSIKDVDIHLYRGPYTIDTLTIEKIEKGKTTPFFTTSQMDISIEWKSLLKGSVVSEFYVKDPVINFIKKGKNVDTGGNNDFIKTIKELSPVTINRFEITNGQVHYIDNEAKPHIDIMAKNIRALALNLRNVEDSGDKLPSTITLDATTSGGGIIKSRAKINALKDTPDFDLNFELTRMDLTYLKDFTDAYAGFTFKRGQLYLSTELAMQDGKYNGYLKPVLENIKIIDLTPDTPKEKKRSFFKKLWELVVGAGVSVVKNHPKDRLATRIPLKGDVNGLKNSLGQPLSTCCETGLSKPSIRMWKGRSI